MLPNWDDLRIFLSLARNQSLTAAGRELRLDAATVGRRVARMEGALGVVLFARSQQGYELTGDGERFLAEAETVETAFGLAVDTVRGASGALTGTVRIGAPDGCANFVLPRVCADISKAHPELELQIVALPRILNLSKREVDLAIAVSPPQTGRLSVQKITDYHLHMVVADRYGRSLEGVEKIEDIREHAIVGYIPEMIFDQELDYLADLGLRETSFASNSVSVQFQMVCQGAGLGIVHDFAIPFGQGLQKILTDQISLTRSFYLIRHSDDKRSERLSQVAALLSQGVKTEIERLEAMA